MTLQPGSLVELRAESLVAGGDAIARVDGFPIFVPTLFPDDLALVRITEVKKGFGRGVVEELRAPGPQRRTDPCPIAGECGGCDWTALRLDHQLRAKRDILLESLRRVGKLEIAALPPIRLHPSPLRYRLRSRLHVSGGEVGFFARGTHRVVPLVPDCEVVGPLALRELDRLRAEAMRLENGSIDLFESDGVLAVESDDTSAPPSTVSIEVIGHRYTLSITSFFQVNRHLLPELVRLIRGSAEQVTHRRLALDLYSGVGFFSVVLAKLFDRVISVEGVAESHAWSIANLAPLGNATARFGSVEEFVATESLRPDFILLDPPRAGLAPEVIEGVDAMAPQRVCYVSCDPVTFSRDASRLVRRGWKLLSLDLLDLFPNTHHVETLASFERAS